MNDHIETPFPWMIVVGAVFGGIVLVFFMALVVMATQGKEIPCQSHYLVVIVLALGIALSASFLGGAAAVSGSIPWAFANDHPVQFSLYGGVGVALIFLVVGWKTYASEPCRLEVNGVD